MIYFSTACIKEKNLISNIKKIVDLGYHNIELTGGCDFLESIEGKLINLQREFKINFLIHNYFPPPIEQFVINTSDKNTFFYLKNYLRKSINLCKLLKSPFYSIHAGFLISLDNFKNIDSSDKNFLSENDAIQNMKIIYDYLENLADKEVKIYIENNVIGYRNYKLFGNRNPFLLTCSDDFNKIRKVFNFNFLLDLAHLKVSCNTLGYNFIDEANYLINSTDYIHLSGNDNLEDNNISILNDDILTKFIENTKSLYNKKITLEIYSGNEDLINSYNFLKRSFIY